MVTYRLTIGDMGLGGLYLGTIEALVETRVLIDINEWRGQFGSDGVIALTFTPPAGAAVALPYELDGDNVIWAPTHESFYSAGVGEISIMLIAADGSIMAKKTNQTIVEDVPASTLAMTRAATTAATPETTRNALPHVIVSGRDMIIPQGIQEISVRGDSNSARVVFDVDRYFDGVDLGMRSFFVEILNPKNQYDTVIPSTEIEGDKVCVTWEVQKRHTAVAGQIRVKLKVTSNGDYIWQTHSGFFTVADTFDGNAEYVPEPTITAVEQALEEMKEIAEEIDGIGTYVVTVTYDDYDKKDYADKSVVDILKASEMRKVILVKQNGTGRDVYDLVHARSTEAIFVRVVPWYNSATGEISYYTAQGFLIDASGEAKNIVIRVANYNEVPQYAVEYNKDQDLTEIQKSQARKNIGVTDTTFVVNLIYDTYDKVYYPDKNYDQIVEASKTQKVFLVRGSGSKMVYELTHIVSSGAVFARLNVQHDYTSGEVLSCLADGCVIGSDGGTKFFSTKLAVDADIPTNVVQYTEQSLTDAQKDQARKNIGVVPAYINKVAEASPLLESANGKVISVDGSAKKPLHSLVLYGGTKQNTTTGKQFFDASQVPTEIVSGVAIAYVGDGWVSLRGTVEADAESTEVALTIPTNGSWYGIYEKTGTGNPVPSVFLHTTVGMQPGILSHDLAETPQAFMTGSQMGLCFLLTAGDIIDAKLRVTLYNADQSDGTWEPYTGGMPSPNSQYPQPLVTVGANGNVKVSAKAGLSDGGGNEHIAIITQPKSATAPVGTTVVFAVDASGARLSYQWMFENANGDRDYSGMPGNKTASMSVEATEGRNGYKYWCVITDAHGNTAMSDEVTLTIGEPTATENPVTVQTATITTSSGLPGVPVTSGGNYTDANGQQWIADTVEYNADDGTAKYTKRVHVVRLTSTSHEWTASGSLEGRYLIADPTPAMTPENVAALCTAFRGVAGSTSEPNVVYTAYGSRIGFNSPYATLNEWKAYLDANEIYLAYAIKTPVETKLSAEETAQLAALMTHNPHTTIYNDEGAQMDAEYVLETRTYIDKRTTTPPVNLLDNSNFACPINQRELTVYSGTGYTIDRWKNVTTASTLTIVEGGIEFARTSSSLSAYILQYLNETDHVYFGKTYTFAIGMMDGSIYTAVAVFPTEISTNNKKLVEVSIPNGTLSMYSRGKRGSLYVQIRANSTDNPLRIAWAAVYEGEYDADTIPSYCPKARAIEEAECERYYTRIGKTKEYAAHNYDVTKYFSKLHQTPTAKIYSEADAAGKISVYASEGSTASEVAATLEVLGPSSVRVKCESGVGVYSYNYIELTADL